MYKINGFILWIAWAPWAAKSCSVRVVAFPVVLYVHRKVDLGMFEFIIAPFRNFYKIERDLMKSVSLASRQKVAKTQGN